MMYTIQTNLCSQLLYLDDQRNLKIYNKKYFWKNIYRTSYFTLSWSRPCLRPGLNY